MLLAVCSHLSLILSRHFFCLIIDQLAIPNHVPAPTVLWKGNATALRIQVNDHHFYFIIDVEDTVWGIDMVMGNLRDVQQTTHTAISIKAPV